MGINCHQILPLQVAFEVLCLVQEVLFMIVTVIIVCAILGLVMAGLSVWAFARFRHQADLPLQWTISRSQPLSETVLRSGPRAFVLNLIPGLGIAVMILLAVGAATLTPHPGQEEMLLPAVLFIGCIFVASYVLHLWLIAHTLLRDGD